MSDIPKSKQEKELSRGRVAYSQSMDVFCRNVRDIINPIKDVDIPEEIEQVPEARPVKNSNACSDPDCPCSNH